MAAEKGPTIPQRLVELAEREWGFVRDRSNETFATKGAAWARPLRGGADTFSSELAAAFFDETGQVAASGAVSDAVRVLDGKAARVERSRLEVRVAALQWRRPELGGPDDPDAEPGSPVICLDLGDVSGRWVRVTREGWRIQPGARATPLFYRTRLTQPMPAPDTSARLDDLHLLKRHTNIAADDWGLCCGWLVAALLPDRSCPLLFLTGEQGTAKTTSARHLRQTIDPSPAPLGAPPDDVKQYFVVGRSQRVLGLDNLSGMPPWLSDALCRAITGDGYATRALYSDHEVAVIELQRAVIATSIDAGSLRGDLAERMLPLELENIGPAARQDDAVITARFEEDRPRILGALLTLTAEVLDRLPDINLSLRPRMADFARVQKAVDDVLGTDGTARYWGGAQRLAQDLVESDPLASTLRAWVAAHQETTGRSDWRGTGSDLLTLLNVQIGEGDRHKPKWWPEDGAALSRRLRRSAPALRELGLDVTTHRSGKGREIRLQTFNPKARRPKTRPTASDQAAIGAEHTFGDAIEGPSDAIREGGYPNRVTSEANRVTSDSQQPSQNHQKGDASDAINPLPLPRTTEFIERKREEGENASLASLNTADPVQTLAETADDQTEHGQYGPDPDHELHDAILQSPWITTDSDGHTEPQ